MNLKEKIKKLAITSTYSLLGALQKMDKEVVKSLLVLDGNKFITLISIGDIQRAIIKNLSLEEKVVNVSRKEIKFAHIYDDITDIKNRMMHYRMECMPVVNDEDILQDIYLWEEFFGEEQKVKQLPASIPVVVMAGGFGSRLKPLTNVIPKPLIPINDKTILEVILDKFTAIGLKKFFFTVNYKHEMIRFYFDTLPVKYDIDYVLEAKPLGTAGSLSLIKDKIKTTFFVTNCDIIINDEYADIYDYHKSNGNLLTIVASLKHLRIPYGTIESGENGELLELKEKPELTFLINTGMYILEPEVLDYIQEDAFIHITEIIERIKNSGKKVGVYPVSEKSWTDIGEWSEYQTIIDKYIK